MADLVMEYFGIDRSDLLEKLNHTWPELDQDRKSLPKATDHG
jgi:hypothetical protein